MWVDYWGREGGGGKRYVRSSSKIIVGGEGGLPPPSSYAYAPSILEVIPLLKSTCVQTE